MDRSLAAVCLRGHVLRGDIGSTARESELLAQGGFPEIDKFCGSCGAAILSACPACDSKLRGAPNTGPFGIADPDWSRPDAYCYGCGAALPWTRAAMDAVRELAEADDALDDTERDQLVDAIGTVASGSEGPESVAAASRLRGLTRKMAKLTGDAVYKIAVDVITAETKIRLGL